MANGDSLKKVQSGQPLRIPARAYNAFVETARAHARHEQDRTRDAHHVARATGVIQVRNDTGEDRHRFEVLGLDTPIVTPEDNLQQFTSRVAFNGVEPTEEHRGRFALLLEPLKPGAIGTALVSGVGVAQVEIEDESHAFVDIAPANDEEADPYTLYSTAGSTSGAQILWKEEGTGLKWAVLRLGPGAVGTFPARVTAVAHVAIDHADYGKMAWQEVRWDAEAGAWADVEDGRSGAIAELTHAREINGRPMVAPGSIVLMSAAGSGFWFSMDSAPTYEDLGDLADEQYQTTDFDHDNEGGPSSKWFDRDHVHHGGPTSRYDPQGALVPMPGAHVEGWPRAWFARLVNFLRNPDADDPNEESFEPEHHDNLIELDRRLLHGDPAGHLQWVGPSTGDGESELEGTPPKLLVRHKEPGEADSEMEVEITTSGAATGGGTIGVDRVGHITAGKTINVHVPTEGIEGPEGPQGPQGPKGDPGDPADITINGHSPWISVAGSNTDNVTIEHGGPGPAQNNHSFIAPVGSAPGTLATGGLGIASRRADTDQYGHHVGTADIATDRYIPQVLGDLGDVSGSPSEGDVLVYSGGQWTPVSPVTVDVVTDVALDNGELKQTKREIKALPELGEPQTTTVAETEAC